VAPVTAPPTDATSSAVSKAQLEQYQDALETWVVLAQKEERERMALEKQIAEMCPMWLPTATPAKEVVAAQEEVTSLQSQLAEVKAKAERSLATLRKQLEAEGAQKAAAKAEAAALKLRQSEAAEQQDEALEQWVGVAQREERQRLALEQRLQEAEQEIVKLRTPQKSPRPVTAAVVPMEVTGLDESANDSAECPGTQLAATPRRSVNQQATQETTMQCEEEEDMRVAKLAAELKELKQMFLASQSPAPNATPRTQAAHQAPIPSPRRVLATPQPVRGSPYGSPAPVEAGVNDTHMHALNRQIRDWVSSADLNADLTPQLADYISHVQGWKEVHNKWFVKH
jgi:hypothetical protein